MSRGPILIMAGGTGGHVFPGLAVAEYLRAQGEQVCWLGTSAGLEARLVPQSGITLHTLPVSGLRGKGAITWLLAPWKLSVALWAALVVLPRIRPSAVLGLGGFASGPGGLMASALGYPLVIHEQNAIPGLTNRWLARLADRVLEAFPGSFAGRHKAMAVGNPVRPEITALPSPEKRFEDREGPLRLLVVGGSLGALALNTRVPEAIALMPAERRPLIWHQAGERTVQQARQAYEQADVEARIDSFIDDMAKAYAWADLLICRSGALTVSEIAAAGVASILVPYPHAVDDHQRANGLHLADAGAALLLPQEQLDAQDLAETLLGLDRSRLLGMALKARSLARPDATRVVAEACLALASGVRP